jgi:hypothetical protein
MLAGETAVAWAKDRMSAREAAASCLHAESFTATGRDRAPGKETA